MSVKNEKGRETEFFRQIRSQTEFGSEKDISPTGNRIRVRAGEATDPR